MSLFPLFLITKIPVFPAFLNLIVSGKTPLVVIIAAFLAGCTTIRVSDVPCPDRPDLLPMPVDLQIRMPPDAVFIVAENQLALKEYAKKLEVRAGCGKN